MRILAFSPFDLDTATGNVVTLLRVQRGLRARGHSFEIVAVAPKTTPDRAREAVRASAPDVLHFYHAFKTGRLLPAVKDRPTLVTISGTDLNHCLDDAVCRPVVERALREADRLVTYNPSLVDRLRRSFPPAAAKLALLPKGVTLGDRPFDLRGAAGLSSGEFVFLQAGGIRPVKNNLVAIDALRLLREEARLVFAGPILDPAYGRELARALADESWARHVPNIPFEAMAAAYRQSGVVLNTSLSEGMSNALMEAMACGATILAADIPGNRDLLQDGATGLLYKDVHDLTDRAGLLIRDGDLRIRLTAAARRHASEHFSTDRELDALLESYSAALASRR